MGWELASKEGKKKKGEGTARPSSHAQKFCPHPSLADGKLEDKRSLETFRLLLCQTIGLNLQIAE